MSHHTPPPPGEIPPPPPGVVPPPPGAPPPPPPSRAPSPAIADLRRYWPVIAGVLAFALVLFLLWVIFSDDDSGSSAAAQTCSGVPVAQDVLPSVVTIKSNGGAGAGTGSGEFIDNQGDVLTNNHVISNSANGGTIVIVLSNGDVAPATIVGRDILTDLAVLRADVMPGQSRPIHFDTSGNIQVGQQVFPVGAPLGLSDTVTTGIVGNTGRTVRVPADNGRTALLVSALQTDASINPGNSGGTLANCDGDLVGVPTAGATATDSVGGQVGGSIGLGFAISANTAQTVANELLAHGRVTTHSYLGVSVVTVSSSPTGPWGLYVTAVSARSPARQAGLQTSDVITEINGAAVRSADDLETLSLTNKPGDKVDLTYERGGKAATVTVTLAAQPT
jgi:putative serine protease PepD